MQYCAAPASASFHSVFRRAKARITTVGGYRPVLFPKPSVPPRVLRPLDSFSPSHLRYHPHTKEQIWVAWQSQSPRVLIGRSSSLDKSWCFTAASVRAERLHRRLHRLPAFPARPCCPVPDRSHPPSPVDDRRCLLTLCSRPAQAITLAITLVVETKPRSA